MELSKLSANWNYPTQIYQGIGRVKEVVKICNKLNIGSVLLVTDRALAEMDMIKAIQDLCEQNGVQCSIFSDVDSNPTESNVEQGVKQFKLIEKQAVIAVGGGSALDAGKAIALMSGQSRNIWDFIDEGDNWQRVNVKGMAPVIAIPTTAGTGSEVGRAAVITDSKLKVKRLIFHPNMMPKAVILDAELTINLPKPITAATGMDALSHALEAYCAPFYHPMAEAISIEAIRLVKSYLPIAYNEGTNKEARAQMLVASTMGATAFQRGLGAMHALAHPIGAIFNAHHGLLNAILMPYVLLANRSAIEHKIENLAAMLKLPVSTFDGFFEWIMQLRLSLDIPNTLASLNINIDKADEVANMAILDPSAAGNPISFSCAAYKTIFVAAVTGRYKMLTDLNE